MPVDSVEFIPGPLTGQVSREQALGTLRRHPAIQKGAAYALEQLNGQWVAAVVTEKEEDKDEQKDEDKKESKVAGPFPPGQPNDAEDDAPGDKSEGPGDEGPSDSSEDSGPPKPEGESGPPKSKGEGGSEKSDLHKVLHMLTQIFDALGLSDDMGGEPGDMGPAGPAGPPGPPAAPGGPAGMKPGEQHVIHERVTKPGETPPGGTPVGAPAFASVREAAGRVASMPVVSSLGEGETLEDAYRSLTALAQEIDYRVSNLEEYEGANGERVARAVLTRL